MSDKGFESLKVWQKAHALMLDVHKHVLPLLPKEEKYGLADQMRRSSKSVGLIFLKAMVVFITWTMCGFVTMPAALWMKW